MSDEIEEGTIGKNGHGDTADIILVKQIFNTSRDRMAELTNIPLDQVRPLSMMATYIEEIRLLCEDIKQAQKQYNILRSKYHKGEPRVDVESDSEFDTEKIGLLMDEWMFRYYQLRRSIGGDHKIAGVTLAQDQIAAQQQEGMSADDLIDRMKTQ